MKAHALLPALVLAAALGAPPLADAASRHRSDRGRRPPAHGYYSHRPSHGYHGHGYRAPRPYHHYYPRHRHYYAPRPYYGYGYGCAYGTYGYGCYPPPPHHCPPRPRIGFWIGF
jgi:hypothetical protein